MSHEEMRRWARGSRDDSDASEAMDVADEIIESLLDELESDELLMQLLAERGTHPTCAHCPEKRIAICFGCYESGDHIQFACDECCGHGNEDGWCRELSELANDLTRFRDDYSQAIEERDQLRVLAGLETAQKVAWETTANTLDSYIRNGEHNTLTLKRIRLDHHSRLKAARALAPAAGPRCDNCDGTGDVHSADGQWLGVCRPCVDAAPPSTAQHAGADGSCVTPAPIEFNCKRCGVLTCSCFDSPEDSIYCQCWDIETNPGEQ